MAYTQIWQTFSLTQSAFLALSVFPEVLQKAQAELDAVVGADRMPEFSDFESLVYLHALVKEVMRWHNVVPLGLPHGTIDDDELQGYFIPRGTMVLANIWCVQSHAIFFHSIHAVSYHAQGLHARSGGVREP